MAASACKRGTTHYDVVAVLESPEWVMSMPALADFGLGGEDRLNVDVYGGYGINDVPLVVFVDRFEEMAFHSEPGLPKYQAFYPGGAGHR